MRMNQQYQQRQNGSVARQRFTKANEPATNNNHGQRHHHHQQQQQQTSVPKQEFKPVAILKRGDPSGTTIVSKEDSQSKENIAANGQPTKATSYRVRHTEHSLVLSIRNARRSDHSQL
jgi:hypothetical protein